MPNPTNHIGIHVTRVADALGCHFTFERVGRTPGDHLDASSISLIEPSSPLDEHVKTVDELVADLRAKLVGITIKVDKSDKRHPVIHFIDDRLAKKPDYVMDRKIDLSFSGDVGDLGAEIGKIEPGIERPSSGVIPGEAFNDHVTKVTVDAKQETVRDVLTHAVDLDTYGSIIWISKTYQRDDGTWTTQVRFTGPKQTR